MERFDVDELLDPLPLGRFLDDYWERKPLHIARGDAAYFHKLFHLDDLDTLLAQSRPRFPQVRVVAKDRQMPAEQLLDGGWLSPVLPPQGTDDARVRSLYELFANGYTLVVELQRLWRPVSLLCRSLDESLQHKASAELYLTPAGAQGFDLHYDQHNVFLLQIDGAKRWQVWEPAQRFPAGDQPVDRAVLGEPLIDATVESGDLLYIPRGFPHQGRTAEQSSLHITFGIWVHRWHDLLAEALRDVADRDVRFREALPLGLLSGDGATDAIDQRLRELLAALLEQCDTGAAVERLGKALLAKMEPVPDGHFATLDALDHLALDSEVEKRAGALCLVTVDRHLATVHFPGGSVNAPAWVEPALRFLCEKNGPFVVADLPDLLDGESKLVLVRRLVREGLLRAVRSS